MCVHAYKFHVLGTSANQVLQVDLNALTNTVDEERAFGSGSILDIVMHGHTGMFTLTHVHSSTAMSRTLSTRGLFHDLITQHQKQAPWPVSNNHSVVQLFRCRL